MLHFEPLENRQLLSASLHPAAKTKPTIPNIVEVFTGTGNETKPIHATGDLRLDVTSESSKGIISGTFTNVSQNKTSNFTGKITAKGTFSLKTFGTTGKIVFAFSGKYASISTSQRITGKYKGAATKTTKTTKPSSGTFSLSPELQM